MEPQASTSPDHAFVEAVSYEQPDMPPAPAEAPAPKKRYTSLIIALVILVVGGIVVLALTGVISVEKLGLSSGQVAAVVNGEKITEAYVTERLNQARPQLEQQGFNFNDTAAVQDLHDRAVDDLVKETLLIQQAKSVGIEIADADVSSQYDGIVTGLGGEEQFQAALVANGLTADKLRADLRRQLYVERYVERFASERGITVTDPEIEELYSGLKKQNAELPPLVDIRQSLHNQILQQKIATLLGPYLEELRAGAEVKIL